MSENPEKDATSQSRLTPMLFGIQILTDFGMTIAIPVVLLTLLGKKLDEQYATRPLFIIAGFALAFLISAISIYRKAKAYSKVYKNI